MKDILGELKEIRSLMESIQKDLAVMKSRPCQIEKHRSKTCAIPIHPTTFVIDIASKSLDDSYSATALILNMPASAKSGQRKPMPEASVHQSPVAESNIMVLGAALQSVGLQNPKTLLIRTDDDNLLNLVRNGHANGSIKGKFLAEDIELLRKRIDIQVEHQSPTEDLISLLFEAETEYNEKLKERSNEPHGVRNC